MGYDDIKKSVLKVGSNKKYQWVATILILAIVLFMSSSIRLSNWDLLTDHTTGEKIPLALDPFYFLRVAETIVATDGNMPEFDSMRYNPAENTPWHPEIMPQVVVWMWKASGFFGDYSLQAVDIFSPVLFYGIGLILFFILVYVLTNSKFAGVLASSFLAFTPAYLYRTMAGFSDHEAIGMIGFFGVMLAFVLSLKYLDKLKKGYLGAMFFGILTGAFTALTISTWGGVSSFIFMIIPIGFLLFWLIKLQDKKSIIANVGIIYYVCWMFFSVIFGMIMGYDASSIIDKMTNSNGIITIAVLGFIILDRLFIYFGDKIKWKSYNPKYRVTYSVTALIISGIALLPLIGKNFFTLIWNILNRLLNPVGGADRLGSTVAENAQPYLLDWINTTGSYLFWLFVAGIFLIGFGFSKNVKNKMNKYLLILGTTLMISGILFSRISASSILNGLGIFSLSGFFYLGGVAFFGYAFFKNYFEERLEIDSSIIVLFSWMFIMLVVGRSTTRLFFVIAPFMCLVAGYFIFEMLMILKKGKLEEVSKVLLIGILIVSIFASGVSIYSSYTSIENQAKYTGPSANDQWQGAMEWVRENTSEDSVFSHWWDYGYWVQTLGERTTVADGGHFQGKYDGNYKIGRYVLTTPRPETALSFFKTMGVDYLLIDQTDLGKYPAYSKIGGGNDAEGKTLDRYSAIPVMPNDPKQTVETANGTMIVFNGGMYLFEDINYQGENGNVFLPSGKAAIVGVVINLENNSIRQPEAVYVYNNIQTRIPVRYVYMDGKIVDFGSGLDVVIDVIPAFTGNSINPMGAAIYLSQKVSKGLFARLYLMNDAFGEYETLKLAHTEDSPVIASLKAQGVPLGDFVYYQGFRGPIKIWDVSEIPDNIKIVPEFMDPPSGIFGILDEAKFS